jgi:hypothetical protein
MHTSVAACDETGAVIPYGSGFAGGIVDGFAGGFGVVRGRTAQKRGAHFLAALVEKQTTCLRKLGGSRAHEVRFGRFLRNPAVSKEEMLAAAGMATGSRVGGRRVLVIQDTTELNFSGHVASKRGFGTVGNGVDIGFFLHPQVVLDALSGGIVGLAGATVLNRTKRPEKHRRARPIDAKESKRWLDGAETAGRVLADALEITVVGDRESDIYQEFACRPDNVHLLTRAAQDRAITGGGKLFAFAASLAERARYAIDVPAKGGRPARKATVALGFGAVSIERPRNGADQRLPAGLPLHVVDVREIDPPHGDKPVHWCLLTTHVVASLEDAHRIVGWYRRRWTIEQVFRTLKGQGFAIEESQIIELETLAKLATAALIAAVRVMQLVQARDGATGQKLADAFRPEDEPLIEALVVKLEGKTQKQKNPHPPGTLARAAWVVGRLGGWDGYVGHGYKPAGPKTMYHGLIRFDAMKHGWNLAHDE